MPPSHPGETGDAHDGRSPGSRVILLTRPSRLSQWGSTRPCVSRRRLQWRGPRRHFTDFPRVRSGTHRHESVVKELVGDCK